MPLKKRNFRSYNPAFEKSVPADRKRTNTVPLGAVSSNVNRDIFRAPNEVLLDQISIIVSVALPTDAVNNWKFDVKLISAAIAGTVGASVLTAPITITTGLAAQVNLDLTVAANTYLGPNDVLQLQITKNGVPVNLQDLLVILDWEVTGVTTTTSTSTTTTTTTTTTTSTSTSSTTSTSISTTTTLT